MNVIRKKIRVKSCIVTITIAKIVFLNIRGVITVISLSVVEKIITYWIFLNNLSSWWKNHLNYYNDFLNLQH